MHEQSNLPEARCASRALLITSLATDQNQLLNSCNHPTSLTPPVTLGPMPPFTAPADRSSLNRKFAPQQKKHIAARKKTVMRHPAIFQWFGRWRIFAASPNRSPGPRAPPP